MHSSPVTRLYPLPALTRPLKGLYLAEDVREVASTLNRPFVYSNFVTPLDGRVAVTGADGELGVPRSIANDRDWRLFQELAAQADILIATGPFLSKMNAGKAEPMVMVEKPAYADLADWRKTRGLSLLPDLAVVSRSLNFDVPAHFKASGRTLHLFSGAKADPERVQRLRMQGAEVHLLAALDVNGEDLITELNRLGYRVVFSPAGPRILHMLAASGVLDRLYLTITSTLLGGNSSLSLVEGGLLEPAVRLQLRSLFLDRAAPEGADQLLAAYDLTRG